MLVAAGTIAGLQRDLRARGEDLAQLRADLDARHFECDSRGRANTELAAKIDAERALTATLTAQVRDLDLRAAAHDEILAAELSLRGEATARAEAAERRVRELEVAVSAEAVARSQAEAEVERLTKELTEVVALEREGAVSAELETARRQLGAARSDLAGQRELVRTLRAKLDPEPEDDAIVPPEEV